MGDFIDREQAIKCAEESYKMWNLTMAAADGAREINKCYKMQDVCKAIGEVFKIVPAADVAPVVHGRWRTIRNVSGFVACDKCGYWCGTKSKYCPDCGAEMNEEEHNNV